MEEKKFPEPRDLTPHLYQDFGGELGQLASDMWYRDSGKDSSFTFTAQDCQRRLQKVKEAITNGIEGLKQGKYFSTGELNVETLEEFSKFLQTFMQEGRMLTNEEVDSISDRFNKAFPKS